MSTIKVTITPTGKIETEVQGVKGTGCTAILDALTAHLGTVIDDAPTAEYYEAEAWEAEDAALTATW